MKRKLLAVFLTAIMIMTLLPAACFAASGQNAAGQLYWFDVDGVELSGDRIVEYCGETDPQNFEVADMISTDTVDIWTCGYFAVKNNGEYFVVTGLEEVRSDGFDLVESDSQDKAYDIHYKGFGKYSIEAEYEGKTYSIILEIALPDTAFYRGEDRNSDTLIWNEGFRFADEVKDGSDEAYFYLISKVEENAEQMAKVTTLSWDYENGKWQEKKIDGIKIGDVSKVHFDSEDFYICRITVDKSYTGDGREDVGIRIADDATLNIRSITIYGSQEPATANMLYWIDNRYGGIDIDDDGKLQGYDIEDIKNPMYIECYEVHEGYFAVKKGADYYAADNVTSDSTDFEISKTGEYQYKIRGNNTGKYKLNYGKNYTLNATVTLPEIGFYSDEIMSAETYLDGEFYYADAKLKNDNGASFYVFASAKHDDEYLNRENTKVEMGTWVEGWFTPEKIEGISFGPLTQESIDGETYYKCKVSVSKDYRNDEDVWHYINITDGTSYRTGVINIYDSTEPLKDEQLYWFSENEEIKVNGDKLELDCNPGDGDYDLDNLAQMRPSIDCLEDCNGYFAVKKDGEYYVVKDNVKASDGSITINELNDGVFNIKNSKVGKFKVTGTYGGKTYAVNMFSRLPLEGIYSKPERTAEAYLPGGVFRYDNAVSKKGNEAYFYVISRWGMETDNERVVIAEWKNDGSGTEKKIEGISFGDVEKRNFDGQSYLVCKVTVNKDYKGKGDVLSISIIFEDNEFPDEFIDLIREIIPVSIYGSTETTPAPAPGGGGGGGLVIPPQETKEDVKTITDSATSKKTTSTTVKDIKTETVKNEAGQRVSKTTASISKETAENLAGQAVSNKVDTVEITVESNNTGKTDGEKSTEVAIPKSAVDSIANNTDAGMVIKTGAGQIALDSKALGTIASAAGGDTVRIVVNENIQLAESQKPAEDVIGSNGTIFDVAAYIGNTRVYDLKDGSADVMLPVPEKLKGKDIAVISISDKGICELLNHSMETVGAGSFAKFKTSQFINYAIVEKADADKYIEKQNTDKVKALIKDAKLKVTTSKTSKKNIKVKVGVKTDKNLIKNIEDMGYTVKYKFYRSTKKTSKYSILKTKNTASYVNSSGKKGTKYYYKAKVLVYDGKTLVAQTALKQCSCGSRVWSK